MRRFLKYQLGTAFVLLLCLFFYALILANHWYWQLTYNQIEVGMPFEAVDKLLGRHPGYVNPDAKQSTLQRGHLEITIYFDRESGSVIGKEVRGENLFWEPFAQPPSDRLW
jgi:hypothetical protein